MKKAFCRALLSTAACCISTDQKLLYPGDVLHEAGHIAVVPSAERHLLNAETISLREAKEAEEMSAISWSYAAGIALKYQSYICFS